MLIHEDGSAHIGGGGAAQHSTIQQLNNDYKTSLQLTTAITHSQTVPRRVNHAADALSRAVVHSITAKHPDVDWAKEQRLDHSLLPYFNNTSIKYKKHKPALDSFLRNADIYRINVVKVQLHDNNTKLQLVIDCPKEKRKGLPIERVTVIQQHTEPTILCPIRTYLAYTHCIATTPCVGPHPTRPSRQLDFLVRSLHDFKVAVGPQTIGRHVRSILAMVEVENRANTSSRPLRARAVGSTDSVLHGASVDDILAHGSWSSSSIFDNFYRLSRETLTNFTHMSLSTVHSEENPAGSTVRVDDS